MALTGCDKLAEAVEQGAQAAASAGLEADAPSADDQLSAKLQGYITCINGVSSSLSDAAERYLGYVDREAGPTKKTASSSVIYEIPDPQACLDGLRAANTAAPALDDVDAAGAAYLEALEAVIPLNAEAYTYYDNENFKDDKLAKGIELHPKLLKAFDAFKAADDTLRTVVESHNDALHERALVAVQQEHGRKLLFHTKNVMQAAKPLLAASQSEFATLDEKALDAAFGKFEAAVDECQTYAEAHEKEADSVTHFSWFLDEAVELKKQAKTLIRRKRDGQDWTDSEVEFMVRHHRNPDGHPAAISDKYNDLVGNSNSLNWHFYEPE